MGAKKLNYSVCIDAVFRESKLSFVEAMSVIHRLGYKAYEFWSWKDKDIKRIKEVQKETGLRQQLSVRSLLILEILKNSRNSLKV